MSFFPGQSICVFLSNIVFTFYVQRSYAKFDTATVSFCLSSACHRHCPDVVSRRKCTSFCYGRIGGSNSLARFNTASCYPIDTTLYVRTYVQYLFGGTTCRIKRSFPTGRLQVAGSLRRERAKGHLTQVPILRGLLTTKKIYFMLIIILVNLLIILILLLYFMFLCFTFCKHIVVFKSFWKSTNIFLIRNIVFKILI